MRSDIEDVINKLVARWEFAAILEDLKGRLAFGVGGHNFAIKNGGLSVNARDRFGYGLEFVGVG